MRRFQCALLATVAVIGFASIATAADMPVKARPMAPVGYNWTGCYIGAHVGYGWGHATNTDDPSSNWFLGQAVDVNGNGLLGGGQIGCDYQFTSNFVIGIQGDLAAAGISGSTLVNAAPITVNAHAKTDWLGTVTGRLGYSFDSNLLYVKGGVAFAHDKYSGDWSAFGFSGTASGTDTRTGWLLGFGLEHAFDKNWSANIEYNYTGFGTHAVSFPVPPPGFGTYIGDISQRIQTVKLGINYRFGR